VHYNVYALAADPVDGVGNRDGSSLRDEILNFFWQTEKSAPVEVVGRGSVTLESL
jgi:hypothetical protein